MQGEILVEITQGYKCNILMHSLVNIDKEIKEMMA